MSIATTYFFQAFRLFILTAVLSFAAQSQQVSEGKLLKEYQKAKSKKEQFWKLYDLASYYHENNYYKADSIRESLLGMSYGLSDSAQYLAQVFDAEIDLSNGNKDLYFDKILDLQQFLNQVPTLEIKLDIYQRIGEYHLYHREFNQAIVYMDESIKMSKKIRNNKQISKSYRLMSQIYMLTNNKDSCYHFVDQALQFARRSADNRIKSDALNNQANFYAYFGQIELSVAKNLNALEQAKKAADNSRIAKISLGMGEAQLLILNYSEAELYFNDVIVYANKIGDKRLIALAQINLGIVNKSKKDYPKAIEYQRKALKLLMPYDDYDGLGNAHNTLGDIYREQEDFIKAFSNYNKALYYFEKSGNREKIATVYHSIGIVFEKQGKYSKALNHLNRSVEIRSQFGYKGSVYSTYQSISDVYFKTGNTKLAYKYLKMYSDYADSAKTLESNTKIAELGELYRSEERQKIISSQEERLDRQKQEKAFTSMNLENEQLKNNLQKYIIIGFIIFMFLAGIIGFYRWNQTKIKQQQQQAEMNQTLLRAQMNPHFVFNAMSVIQSYIYDNDTKNSAKFLINFSKLMRLILENSSKESIPIKTEFEILDKYLNIQKLRFEERFEFKIEVDEALYDEDAVLPPMITQPFIENAIEHGRLHLKEDGFINVHFYKFGNMLRITVEDNGVGRKGAEQNKKSKEHKSMAMKITRDRIDNLSKKYRSDGFLLIEDFNKVEETGTKVLISIPYRVNNQI